MAGVNFLDQQTRIRTDWLQGVNDLFYRVFQTPSDIEDIRVILPEATQQFKGLLSADDLIKLNDIDSPFGIRNFEVEEIVSSRTLVRDDRYKYLRTNSVNLIEVTIPTNASVPFEIGEFLYIEKANTGSVLFTASPGVTLTSPGALGIADQFSITGLIKTGTDEWLVINNETPFASQPGNLAVGSATFPYLHTYDKDTLIQVDNPLEPPTGEVERVRYSPNGAFLAVLTTTDNLIVYDTSNYQRVSLAAQPGMTEGRALGFTLDSAFLVARNTAYDTSDWSVEDAAIGNLSVDEINTDVSNHPSGLSIAITRLRTISTGSNGYFRFSVPSFTALNSPSVSANSRSGAFDPTSAHYALASDNDTVVNRLVVFRAGNFTIDFFNQPSSLPSFNVSAVRFNRLGNLMILGDTQTPFIHLYDETTTPKWNKNSDPTTLPTGPVNDVVVDGSNGNVYFAHDNAPYITVYDDINFNTVPSAVIDFNENATTIDVN